MSRSHLTPAQPRRDTDIETSAEEFVRSYFPEVFTTPMPIDVETLIDIIVPRELGAKFGVVTELKPPIEAVMVPRDNLNPPEILLSEVVFDQLGRGFGRARFTAAHEIGHLILHERELGIRIVEGGPYGLYRREKIPIFQDPEHQANVFAGALLMPAETVALVVKRFGFNADAVAETLLVSLQAAGIRLKTLRGRGAI